MLISDNLPVRKSYFDSNILQNEYASILRRFFFLRIILKRTSTEAHVHMRRHQGAKVKRFDVCNVIYHKFSHGAVSYALNGENVNVMLDKQCASTLWYKIDEILLLAIHKSKDKYDCAFKKVLLI